MARILHVTECYAGGVRQAIRSIIQNSPGHEHHLLWAGDDTPAGDSGFASRTIFRRSFPARVLQVQRESHSLKPDVIHLHSSWAGAYGRILPCKTPVIYQPHAYILTHPDLSFPQRTVYTLAERYFALNTDVVIALSNEEERLAKSIRLSTPVVRLTNVASVRPATWEAKPYPGPNAPANIVMIGRLSPQKDPNFFLRVATIVKQTRPATRFTWIGDGESQVRRKLEQEGIRVTGWLEPEDVERELCEATLYLHSAAYEGFPLSVLDAVAFSLPVVARDIPALENAGLIGDFDEVACAQHVIDILESEVAWLLAVERSRLLNQRMSPEAQASQLNAIYSRLSKSCSDLVAEDGP